MESQYRDRWIECWADSIQIRGYYFPWGTKRIPYSKIRSLRRVEMSTFRGQMRGWGTSNPHYWASLDPQRRHKSVALILDLGRYVKPFVTPDNPDAVEAIIRANAPLSPETEGSTESPFI
ncbi:MAG: hypothetical protein ABSD85_17405 [Acidimicrobiales bacterium]|jgi:hypothetical protein